VVAPYYTAKNPPGYYTDEAIKQPIRAWELIHEALEHLGAQGFDFSQLTTDNQGYLNALNVFYAGRRVNNWAKGLRPHAFHLENPYELAQDVLAHDYQIADMGNQLALGTFCHENGHMICYFPDLYD
jgi:M6 family metalloprotease-like protein